MKILHIINQLSSAGAENMLLNLSTAIKTENVEQEVIALIPEGGLTQAFTSLGVPVSDLGMTNGLPSLGALWKLKRKIQMYNPDIIIGWMYHSCVAASLASPRSIPVIWGIHHTLNRYSEEKLLTRILISSGKLFRNRVARYVYVSEISEQQHVSIGYPSEKSIIIPNGIDLQKFQVNTPVRKKIRRSLGLNAQNIVYGSAGRDHPVKNLQGLVRAFSIVAKKVPTATLLLAGQGIDAQNLKLANEIKHLDLADRVILLGEQSDIPGFMNTIDIYVSSSKAESFPLVLGEAMATETICVSTDVGACAHIIGDTGELIPPDNVEQLADALYKIAVMDKGILNSRARRARKRIVDNFSIDRAALRYLSLCVDHVAVQK